MPSSESKPHIIIAAVPLYGHVRPLRSLAKSLAALGYSISFLTGMTFKHSIERIEGVEFVALTGRANFDPDRLDEEFPGRAEKSGLEQVLFDQHEIFWGPMPEQFDLVQGILKKPNLNGKNVVVITDAGFTGNLPMLLDSTDAIRVPVISIGIFPMFHHSKDTAPFGTGLPSQGEEKNLEMNAQITQIFSGVHAEIERLVKPYRCPKSLPSQFPPDYVLSLPDRYCQLCVPSLEPPRSDLSANVRFCGTLIGANDKKPLPDWFQDFVINDKAERPLVLVTSGTLPGVKAEDLILPTISACKDLNVRLVVCGVHLLPPADSPLPSNVRWTSWIAFEDIFPHTSILISNGGYGGINQALAAGIPMILAGTSEDKTETNIRAASTGAAINLATQTPQVEQILESVQMIMRDERFRERALEMKTEYAECDAVGSIVQAIEELVGDFYNK